MRFKTKIGRSRARISRYREVSNGGGSVMKQMSLREPGSQFNSGDRWDARTAVVGNDEVGRLRGFAAHLLLAQEAEQRRISREIHDDLGQKLALLEIQLERMKGTPRSEAGLVSELEALRGSVAGLAEDLHRICHCLHPVILDNLGLAVGIECLCEEYTRMSGIDVRFVCGDIPPPPPGISLCLYRVVQESLHNVAKHARAKRATVTLCGSSAGIQVTIRDAGCGFDPALSRRDHARTNHGLGLISLSERVRLLGGRCEIRSKPGSGTRIVVFVPFSPQVAAGNFQMD
jgi:signal transduction histidine kinase